MNKREAFIEARRKFREITLMDVLKKYAKNVKGKRDYRNEYSYTLSTIADCPACNTPGTLRLARAHYFHIARHLFCSECKREAFYAAEFVEKFLSIAKDQVRTKIYKDFNLVPSYIKWNGEEEIKKFMSSY